MKTIYQQYLEENHKEWKKGMNKWREKRSKLYDCIMCGDTKKMTIGPRLKDEVLVRCIYC